MVKLNCSCLTTVIKFLQIGLEHAVSTVVYPHLVLTISRFLSFLGKNARKEMTNDVQKVEKKEKKYIKVSNEKREDVKI